MDVVRIGNGHHTTAPLSLHIPCDSSIRHTVVAFLRGGLTLRRTKRCVYVQLKRSHQGKASSVAESIGVGVYCAPRVVSSISTMLDMLYIGEETLGICR